MFAKINFNPFVLPVAALLLAANISVANAYGGDSSDGEWEYSLAPLVLWAQGIEGVSQVGPTTAPLDIVFKDALSNLDATFTVHFEMRRDKLNFFAEYQYVNLGPEAQGPNGVTLDVGFKDTIGELGIGYWVFGTEKTDWQIIGGTRYTKQKLNVALQDGPEPLNIDNDWWVGFFGGRVSVAMSENWSFMARTDYGLGSGDTNRQWNIDVMFDYRFKDWGSVFIGYKYLDYKYDDGRKGFDHYGYDATQQGPLVGLNFHW